ETLHHSSGQADGRDPPGQVSHGAGLRHAGGVEQLGIAWLGEARRAGARPGGGDQIRLRATGRRDVARRAREGDRRLLPAGLLRDLRLLLEDDLPRAAALRSSADEEGRDRGYLISGG